MTVLTATELARNLSRILDRLEQAGEEVVIVRNNRPVGRLIPGAPTMTCREAFGDLYGTLSDEEGAAWLRDIEGADRPLDQDLHDPWE